MADETNELFEEAPKVGPRKWSFIKYIRSIAQFKWWVIGFTVGGMVAGFLGFQFVVNPMTKKLTVRYSYNIAGEYDENDNDTIRFIDGSTFNSYDLTNRDNLEKAKQVNPNFSKVNVDKIVDNNGISINKIVTTYNENNQNEQPIVSISYVVEAKASLFPSDKIGKDYIFELINLPKSLSSAAIERFDVVSYVSDNFADLSFDRQIKQLTEQYDTDYGIYVSLSEEFGSSAICNAEDKKIYELQNKLISNYLTTGSQSFYNELKSIKEVNKYTNYTVGKEEEKIAEIHNQCKAYAANIKNNKNSLAVYTDTLNTLMMGQTIIGTDTNLSKSIVELSETINELSLENIELDRILQDSGYILDTDPASPTYDEYIYDPTLEDSSIYKLTNKPADWVAGCEQFKQLINTYKDKLEADRIIATNTYRYCYSIYRNKVNIQNGSYVQVAGNLPSILGAVLGGVVFFAATSLITATIYVYKKED